MTDYIQVLIDLSTTILAALLGLLLGKHLTLFYKLLLGQVLLYLVTDLIGIAMHPRNTQVYNLFVPVEMGILMAASWTILKRSFAVWAFVSAYVVFLLVYLFEVSSETFAYRSAIAQGFILTGAYLLVLYKVLQKEMPEENRLAVSLASTGMILYFACTIPYLSILYYFQKTNPEWNKELFRYIIVFLALVRYFMIAASFVVAYRKRQVPAYESA